MSKFQLNEFEVTLCSYTDPDVVGQVFPYATVRGPDGDKPPVALHPMRISIAEADSLAAEEAVRRIKTKTL